MPGSFQGVAFCCGSNAKKMNRNSDAAEAYHTGLRVGTRRAVWGLGVMGNTLVFIHFFQVAGSNPAAPIQMHKHSTRI